METSEEQRKREATALYERGERCTILGVVFSIARIPPDSMLLGKGDFGLFSSCGDFKATRETPAETIASAERFFADEALPESEFLRCYNKAYKALTEP